MPSSIWKLFLKWYVESGRASLDQNERITAAAKEVWNLSEAVITLIAATGMTRAQAEALKDEWETIQGK